MDFETFQARLHAYEQGQMSPDEAAAFEALLADEQVLEALLADPAADLPDLGGALGAELQQVTQAGEPSKPARATASIKVDSAKDGEVASDDEDLNVEAEPARLHDMGRLAIESELHRQAVGLPRRQLDATRRRRIEPEPLSWMPSAAAAVMLISFSLVLLIWNNQRLETAEREAAARTALAAPQEPRARRMPFFITNLDYAAQPAFARHARPAPVSLASSYEACGPGLLPLRSTSNAPLLTLDASNGELPDFAMRELACQKRTTPLPSLARSTMTATALPIEDGSPRLQDTDTKQAPRPLLVATGLASGGAASTFVPAGSANGVSVAPGFDAAAFAVAQSHRAANQPPPAQAVHIGSFVNAWRHAIAAPAANVNATSQRVGNLTVTQEFSDCPWQADHRLLRVTLTAEREAISQRPPANVVMLVDVSESMRRADRLPRLQQSLTDLARALSPDDRLAIIAYTGARAAVVLAPTPGEAGRTAAIDRAVAQLSEPLDLPRRSPLQLAYRTAQAGVTSPDAEPGAVAVNRIVLATDGDLSLGYASHAQLAAVVQQQADNGYPIMGLSFGFPVDRTLTMPVLTALADGQSRQARTPHQTTAALLELTGVAPEGSRDAAARRVAIRADFNPHLIDSVRQLTTVNSLPHRPPARSHASAMSSPGVNAAVDSDHRVDLYPGQTVTVLFEVAPRTDMRHVLARAGQGESRGISVADLKLTFQPPGRQAQQTSVIPLRDNAQSLDAASPAHRTAAALASYAFQLGQQVAPGLDQAKRHPLLNDLLMAAHTAH